MDIFEPPFGLTTSQLLQYVAFGLGVANVALLVARSIWNYAFAIGSVSAAFFVLYMDRLYLEAVLQVVFIALNVYGWLKWQDARADRGLIAIRLLEPAQRAACAAGIVAGGVFLGWIMARLTDAALPYPDALIFTASIAAQILLALRRLENWILWIAVDLAAVPLYLSRGLYPLAALYAVFLLLSVAGLLVWRRALRAERASGTLRPG